MEQMLIFLMGLTTGIGWAYSVGLARGFYLARRLNLDATRAADKASASAVLDMQRRLDGLTKK